MSYSRGGRRSFDSLSSPSFDNIQHAVFLFTAIRKSSHAAARNDRISSGGINDSQEDSTTMASIMIGKVSAWP